MELVAWVKDHLGVPYWIHLIVGLAVLLLAIRVMHHQSRSEARKHQRELLAKLEALHAICLAAQSTFTKLTHITDEQTFDTAAEEWERSLDQQTLQELVSSFNQLQIQGLQHKSLSGLAGELRRMFDVGVESAQRCVSAIRAEDTPGFVEAHCHVFAANGILLIGIEQLRNAIKQVPREQRDGA